jgi:hypothetical protein
MLVSRNPPGNIFAERCGSHLRDSLLTAVEKLTHLNDHGYGSSRSHCPCSGPCSSLSLSIRRMFVSMPRLKRLLLTVCALGIATLLSTLAPHALAQQKAASDALPPKTARLCINGNACANLTWTGSRYEARGDNQTNVSSVYQVLAWSNDRVDLQGTTTALGKSI